ncbi:MAG TPA: hypothetical protein VNA88_07650 [Candidatus Kapabacteria bacterium]|jgi:hypothetical protein|nr:hypothetical protein [Candidatus Kapabacteria bacterium]
MSTRELVKLTDESIQQIARLLEARQESLGADTLLHVGERAGGSVVVLTLASLADESTVLSAQTVHGYFELHGVQRFVPVEPGEIIFVAETGDRISGLVVGREGTCSLFANVDRRTLSADFASIEPSLLLAAMQLGLAENIPA